MKKSKKLMLVSVITIGCVLMSVSAYAGLRQIKAYKEVFPDAKPKCIDCHVSELPKKDDGQHDLNDYGKAVVKSADGETPKVDAYKTVGKIEDFKK